MIGIFLLRSWFKGRATGFPVVVGDWEFDVITIEYQFDSAIQRGIIAPSRSDEQAENDEKESLALIHISDRNAILKRASGAVSNCNAIQFTF